MFLIISFEQSQLPVLNKELTGEVYFVSGNIKLESAVIPSHPKEKLELLQMAVKEFKKSLEYYPKNSQCVAALADTLLQIHNIQLEKVSRNI